MFYWMLVLQVPAESVTMLFSEFDNSGMDVILQLFSVNLTSAFAELCLCFYICVPAVTLV